MFYVIVAVAAGVGSLLGWLASRPRSPEPAAYRQLPELVAMIDAPAREACQRLLDEQAELATARPEHSSHHAWSGGYLDHVTETMNIALVLYDSYDARRLLPFSLSDALLVLFCHDLGLVADADGRPPAQARQQLLDQYNITLSEQQAQAARYAAGEIAPEHARSLGALAVFCQLCDVTSAQLWFSHPEPTGDQWPGAQRHRSPHHQGHHDQSRAAA